MKDYSDIKLNAKHTKITEEIRNKANDLEEKEKQSRFQEEEKKGEPSSESKPLNEKFDPYAGMDNKHSSYFKKRKHT